MDPASTLGLSTESIHGYSISHVKRLLDAEPPELPPCRRGVNNIVVSLKGQSRTLGCKAVGCRGTVRRSIVYSWSRSWLRGCRVEVTVKHKRGSPAPDSSQGTCSQDISAPPGLPLHPPP